MLIGVHLQGRREAEGLGTCHGLRTMVSRALGVPSTTCVGHRARCYRGETGCSALSGLGTEAGDVTKVGKWDLLTATLTPRPGGRVSK